MTPPGLDACAVALQSQAIGGTGKAWVHLLPAGTFTGRDGRGPYRAENAATIMEASRRLAGRSQMPIDYNHSIDLAATKGGSSPAAGWITALQSRSDGIWGAVEWTARAARHIADREYRYLSPAFTHARDGTVTAILRASLVNYPNLEQLVALASAEMSAMADPSPADLGALREAIDLDASADMAAILAAIRELKTQRMAAGTPDPSQYVPIGDFVRVTQELGRVHKGVEETTARMHVEEHIRAGRLLPFMKDWAVRLCTVNKPAFDDFITKTGGTFSGLLREIVPGHPPPGREPDLSGTDGHVAAVLGITKEEFRKSQGG